MNDNTAQHKSQRVLYILLAFFGIAIVILTIFVIATQRLVSPENPGNYYYYLMTGDANANELNKSSIKNPYIEEMIHSDNPNEYEGFYNTAKNLLDGLKNQMRDANSDGLFETQSMYLNLFRFNNWIMLKNSAGLMDLYISEDSDEKQELASKLNVFADSSDELVKSYVVTVKDLIRQVSELIGYYRNVGCYGENVSELSNCKVQKLIKYKIANYYNGIDADFAEMRNTIDSIVPVFLESARMITEKGVMNE